MAVGSHYWDSKANVSAFKSSADQAASGSKWHVQLNHGVGADWDVISAADIKTLIEYAVSKKLWVASFSTVGAYLRAHFTIDKATATNTANGFTVKWTSPHTHMPKSVPLRVKIQGAEGKTVSQKGKEIKPNSDGTYTIEFMALELEVSGAVQFSSSSKLAESSSSIAASSSSSKTVGSSSSAATSSSSAKVVESSSSAPVETSSSESFVSSSSGTDAIVSRIAFERGTIMVHCQVFDMNGQLIKSANVFASSVSDAWNNIKAGLVNGAYVMRFGEVDGRNMRIAQVKK